MRKLTLYDGTDLENCECGLSSNGTLWCYLKNMTFSQAFSLFSDAEKTAKIDFTYGEMVDSHEGYTTMIAIIQDAEDQVKLALIRPAPQGG